MSNASSKAGLEAGHAGDGQRRWPWHPLQAVVLVVGIFLLSQIGAVILAAGGLGLYARLMGWSEAQSSHWTETSTAAQFVTILLAESIVVLAVGWLLRRRGLDLRQLGFGRLKLQDLWMPVLAFVLYYGVLLIVVSLLQQVIPGLDDGQKQDIGFDHAAGFGQLALVFVALVICAPVAEEVLFRGFLFGNLRQRWSFLTAALVTSAIFGAAHLAGGEQGASALLWIAGIDTLLLSLALCYLREKTGRLWAPILLHSLKNCLAFILLFVFRLGA